MDLPLLYTNRSPEDKSFIREVCNDIIKEPIAGKPESSEFCGIYVDGRLRDVNCLEDYSSLYSFKRFSTYNYPIYVFLANPDNFLNNNYDLIKKWRINIVKIDPIKDLEGYTNFCVKELYNLLPNNIRWGVTLQADAMILKNNWEMEIIKNNFTYVGSPWKHAPSIEYQDIKGNWHDFSYPVRMGNGGFSVRDIKFFKDKFNEYKNWKLREKFAPNDKIPPEDLLASVLATHLNGNVPTVEQANSFCCDPLTKEMWDNKTHKFGFHYFSAKL